MALSQHFEQIRQRAIDLFLEYGSLTPHLYFLKGDDIVAVTPVLFETLEKQAVHGKALEMARILGVDGFIEVCESWYVPPEDRKPGEPKLPPSKHPKKRDCVVIVGRQRGASGIETQMRLYEIIRVGKQVDLVLRHGEEPGSLSAWFDDYFSSA